MTTLLAPVIGLGTPLEGGVPVTPSPSSPFGARGSGSGGSGARCGDAAAPGLAPLEFKAGAADSAAAVGVPLGRRPSSGTAPFSPAASVTNMVMFFEHPGATPPCTARRAGAGALESKEGGGSGDEKENVLGGRPVGSSPGVSAPSGLGALATPVPSPAPTTPRDTGSSIGEQQEAEDEDPDAMDLGVVDMSRLEDAVGRSLSGPLGAHPVVVAIDNDECIGSWADLSMLFTLYVSVLRVEPPVDLFVRLLTDTVCARPGLRTLYDSVLALKEEGAVHSVVMCTAARDSLGWVSFLRVVLERWYGRRVYDHVIEGNMIQAWHDERGTRVTDPVTGCFVKDMHQVRAIAGAPAHAPVVALDDHPENIVNGDAIAIHPYYVAVNLVEVARLFVPQWDHNLEATYGRSMQSSWSLYRTNPGRFTIAHLDRVLEEGAVEVEGRVRRHVGPAVGEAMAPVPAPVPERML